MEFNNLFIAQGSNEEITSQKFVIKNNVKLEVAITDLWNRVFDYLINDRNKDIKTIFVYNLGYAKE